MIAKPPVGVIAVCVWAGYGSLRADWRAQRLSASLRSACFGSASNDTVAPAAARTSNQGNISLEDIRAVKELANRIGADKVRQLAEVLS